MSKHCKRQEVHKRREHQLVSKHDNELALSILYIAMYRLACVYIVHGMYSGFCVYSGFCIGCHYSLNWTTGLDCWTEVFFYFGQLYKIFGYFQILDT